MPLLWEVRCYVSVDGTNVIRAWYDGLPRKIQAKFYSRVKSLAYLDVGEWRLPLFRWLHGDCHPLGEIRFKPKVSNTVHLATVAPDLMSLR
jgi:hypothetical protein